LNEGTKEGRKGGNQGGKEERKDIKEGRMKGRTSRKEGHQGRKEGRKAAAIRKRADLARRTFGVSRPPFIRDFSLHFVEDVRVEKRQRRIVRRSGGLFCIVGRSDSRVLPFSPSEVKVDGQHHWVHISVR
jgi:hypothetical protein